MPLSIASGAPTLFMRRMAYESSGLARAALDEKLGLTADEFRVEGDVIAIGPVYDSEAFAGLLDELERLSLKYYEDFFELSGNWPAWLSVFAGAGVAPRRSNPSQPHA